MVKFHPPHQVVPFLEREGLHGKIQRRTLEALGGHGWQASLRPEESGSEVRAAAHRGIVRPPSEDPSGHRTLQGVITDWIR